jgi:hypothetical protein
LTLVEQHRLAVSEAWEESTDALAVVLTVEPSIGTIYWQLADKDALLEIVEVFQEHRSLLSSVAVRFDGFINWVVGVFDDRCAFLHVARTPHEPHGLQ